MAISFEIGFVKTLRLRCPDQRSARDSLPNTWLMAFRAGKRSRKRKNFRKFSGNTSEVASAPAPLAMCDLAWSLHHLLRVTCSTVTKFHRPPMTEISMGNRSLGDTDVA